MYGRTAGLEIDRRWGSSQFATVSALILCIQVLFLCKLRTVVPEDQLYRGLLTNIPISGVSETDSFSVPDMLLNPK
jgi:hypothetical protein